MRILRFNPFRETIINTIGDVCQLLPFCFTQELRLLPKLAHQLVVVGQLSRQFPFPFFQLMHPVGIGSQLFYFLFRRLVLVFLNALLQTDVFIPERFGMTLQGKKCSF